MSTSKNDFVRTQLQRQRELRDPEISRVLTHWIFHAMDQGPPHPDHNALNRGVAPVDWAGWGKYSPPFGEGCMCVISGVTASGARRMLESGEAFDLTKNAPMELEPEPGWSRKELEATVFGKQKRRTKKKSEEEKGWEEATREYELFVEKDPTFNRLFEQVRPVIEANPGVLQTELYKKLPEIDRADISCVLYFAAKQGKVVRKKKGRTYQVSLLGVI